MARSPNHNVKKPSRVFSGLEPTLARLITFVLLSAIVVQKGVCGDANKIRWSAPFNSDIVCLKIFGLEKKR